MDCYDSLTFDIFSGTLGSWATRKSSEDCVLPIKCVFNSMREVKREIHILDRSEIYFCLKLVIVSINSNDPPHRIWLKRTMSKFDPYEFLKITQNPDGTVTRDMPTHDTEPEPDEASGVAVVSKDVTLCKEKNVWVRVYRPIRIPSNDGTVARLPVVIYFHGGSWVQFTAQDPVAHAFCKSIATMITAIVVSVSYRLAPENRLPAQYDDAVDAIHWVQSQALTHNLHTEPWLHNYADFSR